MSKKNLFMTILCSIVMNTTGRLSAQDNVWNISLEELFRIADEHNTSIHSFESAIQEAETGIKVANAERLPELSAELSVSYLGNGRIMDRKFSNGTQVYIPHLGNNFALKASWAVYTGGAINAGIALAELKAGMAKASDHENRLRVRFMLTGYYLQLHNLHNQEMIFNENITLTETLIAHTQQRQAEGVVLRNDLTRYELQLEQLRLGRTEVQHQQKIITRQLLTALGKNRDLTLVPSETFQTERLDSNAELFWQEEAQQHAPVLKKAELGIEMSKQKEKLEKSALLPDIAMVAEEHLDGPITFEIPNIDKNFNYWFVGVGVKYNISSLYKNRHRVQQARVATATAKQQYEMATETISDAIVAAHTEYQTAQCRWKTSKKTVELATQNYDVVHNRYQNGLSLVTDMVDAANERLSAQLSQVNAQIEMLYHYYQLKYLTGIL